MRSFLGMKKKEGENMPRLGIKRGAAYPVTNWKKRGKEKRKKKVLGEAQDLFFQGQGARQDKWKGGGRKGKEGEKVPVARLAYSTSILLGKGKKGEESITDPTCAYYLIRADFKPIRKLGRNKKGKGKKKERKKTRRWFLSTHWHLHLREGKTSSGEVRGTKRKEGKKGGKV